MNERLDRDGDRGDRSQQPVAYVISAVEGFADESTVKRYAELAGPAIDYFGGRFIVSNTEPVVVEGASPSNHLSMVEFPSMEDAKAWYNSPEELALHYCYVPEGQLLTKTRLIRAAGLRGPVEEDFEFGKDCFGLDQCQARLYTAILRHAVLVMAALAICAVTAAQVKDRTDTQAPPPSGPISRHRQNPA